MKKVTIEIDSTDPVFSAVMTALAGGIPATATQTGAAPAAAPKKEEKPKDDTKKGKFDVVAVRAAVKALIADETKKPAMAELLTKYNTPSVTDMKPEDYEAFMADLEKIK